MDVSSDETWQGAAEKPLRRWNSSPRVALARPALMPLTGEAGVSLDLPRAE